MLILGKDHEDIVFTVQSLRGKLPVIGPPDKVIMLGVATHVPAVLIMHFMIHNLIPILLYKKVTLLYRLSQ